jgi:hypothetical protein
VHILPELALIINTTSSSVLPNKASPFQIWFGRKPHFFETDYRQVAPIELEDDEEVFTGDNGDLVLTEIEAKVAEFNARQHEKIRKRNGPEPQFIDGSIVTLWIPKKLRLRTEAERLTVRILSCDYRAYKLMSQHGRIGGRFQASELNSVSNRGYDIPLEAEYISGKEVVVPLSVVVAQENNRGSISAAQAAGRERATQRQRSQNTLAIVDDNDIVRALATATDAILSFASCAKILH